MYSNVESLDVTLIVALIHQVGRDSIYVRTREHVWVTSSGRLVFERAPEQIEVIGPDQMDQITGVELKSITFGEIASQTG